MRAGGLVMAVALATSLMAPAAALEPNVNYALKCMGCHTPDGFSPQRGRIPPLLDVVGYLTLLPEGRRYVVNVPGVVNAGLSAEDTASLLNWVVKTFARASLPDDFKPFTAAETVAWRTKRPDDPMRLRAEVRDLLAARGISLGSYP